MKHKVKVNTLTGLLLLFYISGAALANMLTPVKPFSESENRVLEGRPDFSLQRLLSGQFTSHYERYTSDQMALRNLWVGMKTDTDRAMGKQESNDVFLGKDGYLMERYTSPSAAQLKERGEVLQAFDQATPELRKVLMLVPTAAAFLWDKLPAYAPSDDQLQDLMRIRELIPGGIRLADAYSALYAERNEPLFYKTDHHWTTKGAFYAYRELAGPLEIIPQDESSFRIQLATEEFYGSLYSKSGFRRLPPDEIRLYIPKKANGLIVTYEEEHRVTDTLYEQNRLYEKDKYAVFLDGNHALIRIVTDGAPAKKLLVVKDSYANSLIPFLTEHYGEIDVVDLRYFSHSLVNLIWERGFQDMLILYNLKTFFEDPSILNLVEEMP
ncbi:DHHW family protein [Paenibacillus sp. MMS20-IR301]|uniref:DHHW family protein n=1 Tax=Paenibacillus sp. MMS20-IR301 TaxID=2895946 RepID=UPI0028EE419D|nr:DHHW family protein [Paenibacillus sp. MMS20-IR301]WNS43089.1 DHHW family protein [Paenibacillus sp. MMS20-IR301]